MIGLAAFKGCTEFTANISMFYYLKYNPTRNLSKSYDKIISGTASDL